MGKLKILKFWAIVMWVIVKETLKGNEWHMIHAFLHYGESKDGKPKRKQLIARKRLGGFDVYWQDLAKLHTDNDTVVY